MITLGVVRVIIINYELPLTFRTFIVGPPSLFIIEIYKVLARDASY